MARCTPPSNSRDSSVPSGRERPIRVEKAPDRDRHGEAWFALAFDGGLPAGQWIRLRYSTSLLGDAQRPFLRLRATDAERHSSMPSGLFGRAEWIGYLPPDVGEVAVSPAILHAPSYEVLSTATVLGRALVRNRPWALHAAAHWLAGRRRDALDALQVACGSTSLKGYHRWRARSLREPDPEGLDGAPEDQRTAPHIRAIIELGAAPAAAVENTLASLDRQSYLRRSVKLMPPPDRSSDALAGLHDRDIVTVLRPGDLLPPYAFATVAHYLAIHPDADLVYGDEDSVDGRGRYLDPQLKPDWSPILQTLRPYVGRAVYRRRGLLDAGSDELSPLISGRMKSVRHIRRVLLTRSMADQETKAPDCQDLKVPTVRKAATTSATIVIPSKDRPDLLLACLSSLRATEGTFDVLVVDNGHAQPEMLARCRSAVGDRPTRILPLPGPFNFSRLCNEAAALARGQVLAFLNDDTVATQPDWLARLSAWAMHADCGAIGPKLVYPSGRVQHGGLVIGLGGYAAHIESGAPGGDAGYGDRLRVTHEVSAVTGACLVVDKAKFDAVCGFDVEKFPVELGDVDLCLRLERSGWKTVLVPEVSLVHCESASRGRTVDREARYAREHAYFSELWHARMRDDPYFHPALSLTSLRTRLDG